MRIPARQPVANSKIFDGWFGVDYLRWFAALEIKAIDDVAKAAESVILIQEALDLMNVLEAIHVEARNRLN